MHSYAPGRPKSAEWFTPHDLRAFYVTQMLDLVSRPGAGVGTYAEKVQPI